jgi:hypothetical protein
MSANPVQGNQTFNSRNVASASTQFLKADQIEASVVTSSSYVAPLVSSAPTGPTGPYNSAPVVGQIVYAATGALGSGAGAGLYVYTGATAGWIHTNLTNA